MAPTSADSIYSRAKVGSLMASEYINNIKDKEVLSGCIEKVEPEVVFHLAAQPLVSESYNSPEETWHTNLIGTLNILEILRQRKSKTSMVCVTTDKCYRNVGSEQKPFSEDSPLGGHDPYSASKAAVELLVESHVNSFMTKTEISIATARAGNVIGGGDSADSRIVPDIIKAVRSGDKLKIRRPYSIRPWQHVLEPIYGYLLLGSHLSKTTISQFESYNFGPEPSSFARVEELVGMFSTFFLRG